MPRIAALDTLVQPALKFRYKIVWAHLPGTFVYAKAVTLPNFSMADVTISRGSYKLPVKSRISWEPITITCYRLEALTLIDLDIYFRTKLQQTPGLLASPFLLEEGDRGTHVKRDLWISYVDTTSLLPVGVWVLQNAFISGMDFQGLDWSSNEIQEISLTVKYDYAVYKGL